MEVALKENSDIEELLNIQEEEIKTLSLNNTKYSNDISGKSLNIGNINSLSYKNDNKSSLQNKIKTPDKTLNLKSSKLNSKLKGVLLNPINLETNIQENKIIDNNPIMNNINIYNSPNKENIKHRPNYSRNETKYKTFSENKYHN